MNYITCVPSINDNFSSGHIFWEIITCFIISIMLDMKVVYNSVWKKSRIKIDYGKCSKSPPLISKEVIDGNRSWGSVSFDKFQELNKYKRKLIILTNVWSIHPDVLLVWEKENYIKTGTYTNIFKPMIEDLYFSVNNNQQLEVISIHLRRGDLYNHTYNDGYNIEYYQNLIKTIKSQSSLPIHIYTEKTGKGTTTSLSQSGDKREYHDTDHDDVEILSEIDGVKLFRGDLSDFESHFNQMCNSKHLVLGLSSMSLIAGFISHGNIYVDDGYKKSRPNLFRNVDLIPNFQVFNSSKEIKILDD